MSRPDSPMRVYHNINVSEAAAATTSNQSILSNLTDDVNSPNNNSVKNYNENSANNILLSPYSSVRPMTNSTLDPDTDSLGFYLNSPRARRETPLALMLMHLVNIFFIFLVLKNRYESSFFRLS